MGSPGEDRLRHAPARHDEPPADGGQHARTRSTGGHLRPRRGLRWPVLAALATMAAVALVVAAVGDGDERVHATARPDRLYLTPTGVDGRFHLVHADVDPPVAPVSPGTFRAYGRRAPDGFALEAAVVVSMPSDFALQGAEPQPTTLRVRGQEITVSTDGYGWRILSWIQPNRPSVAVMTSGLSHPELLAVAESLVSADPATDPPALPAGFELVSRGSLPPGPLPVTIQEWEADDGDGFMVSVVDLPGVTVDDVAWYLPGGRAQSVRGTAGVYSERRGAELVWIERPGTVVTVHGTGLSENDVAAIAEGLRPADERVWTDMVTGARHRSAPGPATAGPPVVSPKGLTGETGYFVICPLEGRSPPPSPPASSDHSAALVPEHRDGQEVSCVRLGPALVAADDVSAATARQGRRSGDWEVEFTLSSEGMSRFEALFRTVGSGGEIAILVDGHIVSAPRVASTTTIPKGVVTGLDEQTARGLAERLSR